MGAPSCSYEPGRAGRRLPGTGGNAVPAIPRRLEAVRALDAGGYLQDQALVDRYRLDLGVIVDAARRAGARVVLVGQPLRAACFGADVEVEGINEVYRNYAAAFRFVSYVDAGRAVEGPDCAFAERLP